MSSEKDKTKVIEVSNLKTTKIYLAIILVIILILVIGALAIFKSTKKTSIEDGVASQKRTEALDFFNSGQVQEALPLLEKADKASKNDTEVKTALAYAYRVADKKDLSFKKYNEILKYNPDDVGTHFRLGIYYRMDSKLKESEEHLEKAAKLSPNTQFLVELSKIYELQSKFSEAEKALRKGAALTDDANYKKELLKQADELKTRASSNQ